MFFFFFYPQGLDSGKTSRIKNNLNLDQILFIAINYLELDKDIKNIIQNNK